MLSEEAEQMQQSWMMVIERIARYPSTRGYLQPVIDEVIANFAKDGYTVVLVASSRNGRHFKVS